MIIYNIYFNELKMNLILFLIISLLTVFGISQSKYLSLEMISRDDDSFIEVLVYIGTPSQGIELKINTLIPYSYIQYRIKESISNRQIPSNDTIMVNYKYEIEPKFSDILSIDNYQIDNFTFYFSSSGLTHTWEQGLGFGLQNIDPSLSIVDLLFDNKAISRKKIYFIPRGIQGNEKKGKFIIGDNPDIKESQYQYKGIYKINDFSLGWGVKLSSIKIGNKVVEYNKYFIISSAQYFAILSRKVFNLIYESIFQMIEGKDCYRVYGLSRDRIRCKETILNDLDSFSFSFDNEMTIEVSMKRLFVCPEEENLCDSLFSGDNNDEDTNEFGTNFIKLFTLSGFDFTGQKISLMSNDERVRIYQPNNYKNVIWIILSNIILTLLGLCNLIVMYIKK